VYVVIAGAVGDEPESVWARQVLSDPRSMLGPKLDGHTDDEIATAVTKIRGTPVAELFAGAVSGSAAPAGIAEKASES
jgi:hypothetical protein